MKNQARELYQKYKIIIYPVAVGLASLFLIVFIIYPQIRAFLNGRGTLDGVNQKAKFLDVKAQQLSQIDESDLNKKLALAVSAVPLDKDYGSIIGLIQQIGADSGVTVTNLSLSPSSNEKVTGFSARVEVAGGKLAIENMIAGIEKSPRVMKISAFDISSSNVDGGVGASFVIEAYYAPAPQSLGAIDAQLPELSQKDEQILANLARSSLANSISLTSPTTTGQLLPRGKANPFQ